MRRKWWIIPAAIVGLPLFIFIGGEVVMHLWNWLLPPLFGWRALTFWQASTANKYNYKYNHHWLEIILYTNFRVSVLGIGVTGPTPIFSSTTKRKEAELNLIDNRGKTLIIHAKSAW